jgi:hypothetical protein
MPSSAFDFFFTCDEPKGQVIREVRALAATDIPFVYAQMASSFAERGKACLPWEDALKEFMRLDKLYWVVDDVGLIIANQAGDVHVFFWDKRLRGREGMCRALVLIICEFYDRDFVWTKIPITERAVIAFAKRIGFQEKQSASAGLVTLVCNRRS